MRQKRAHIERNEDGNYICTFKPDKQTCFVWGWQTDQVVTRNGIPLGKHQFKNIDKFEGWCRVYEAEH